MSPSIWTRCAGSSEVRRLAAVALRVVESQHVTSTRKLVDSTEEQDVLEALLDGVKPPAPAGPGFEGLHYLLATPFRHPPLRHGSRFGSRAERGLFYGALELGTCFAEVAYYRFVFLAGTSAALVPLTTELSSFEVGVRAKRGVDLRARAFASARAALASPTSYAATQRLGTEMRAAGVQAFLTPSARDPDGGTNVALFEPAFAGAPRKFRAWVCTTDEGRVEVAEKRLAPRAGAREVRAYARTLFEVDGALPSPAT